MNTRCSNLKFALAVEPTNAALLQLQRLVRGDCASNRPTLPSPHGAGAAINPFFASYSNRQSHKPPRLMPTADPMSTRHAVLAALRNWKTISMNLHHCQPGSVLWLTGCATTGGPRGSQRPDDTPTSAPAHPLIPRAPLSPSRRANACSREVASLSTPADLWDRIRRGFAMPDLQHELVQRREQWYSQPPRLHAAHDQSAPANYLFHIVEELEQRGMPTELALLPYIESAFNPQAVSSAKAAGMWQFMPATGTYFDLTQNAFRDDRRDVLASTRAALDYLQKLYRHVWRLAPGPGRLQLGRRQRGARHYAQPERTGLGTSYTDLNMPAETRMYVPKLQAVKNIVAHPEAFNTELPLIREPPLLPDGGHHARH